MTDAIWLTYAELGERLHTSAEGARRRALRAQWPRMAGNDKRARVGVPADVLADLSKLRGDRSPPARPSADGPSDNPVHAQIARLEGELAGMREALADARARASLAETLLAAAESRAAAADGRVVEEAAKTAQALRAFESLAERLEAFAATRRGSGLWARLATAKMAAAEGERGAPWTHDAKPEDRERAARDGAASSASG